MNQLFKEESENLLNLLLQFADKELQKRGEFLPFAAVMLINGEVQLLATYNGDEQNLESQSIIQNTEEIFIHRAKNNQYKATGIAYLVSFMNPDTGKKEDAICINLDHIDDYSVKVIYTYTIKKKLFGKKIVSIFSPTAVKGDGKIFAKSIDKN